jgi:hypothetical protein
MPPNERDVLFESLARMEGYFMAIKEDIGEMTGRLDAKEKACQICNADNQNDHNFIFRELKESSTWRAAHDASTATAVQVETQKDQSSLTAWQKLAAGATIFGVLVGSMAGLVGLAKWALSALGVKM